MLHRFGLSFFVNRTAVVVGAISLVVSFSFINPVVGLSPKEIADAKAACNATKNTCVEACARAWCPGSMYPCPANFSVCAAICRGNNKTCLNSIASVGVRPRGPMGGGGILERDQGFGTQGPGATGAPQVGGRGAAPAGQIR